MNGFQVIRQVFANRNYWLYVIGNLFSTSGNWVQRVAMGWLTWELTESAAWLGAIAFADMFPTFIIGLVAGTIVDRTDSMRLLRITQILQFIQVGFLTAMTFTGHITVWWLLFSLPLFLRVPEPSRSLETMITGAPNAIASSTRYGSPEAMRI